MSDIISRQATEPPIVAIYRDYSGIEHSCKDCKHNETFWGAYPCDACYSAHCAFERKEKHD